jgi:hypothetical protein
MGDPEKSDPFEAKATREIAEANRKSQSDFSGGAG